MLLPKQEFDRLKKIHDTVILVPDDAALAFEFVRDVLLSEVYEIKQREPYATNSIARLEAAAQEVMRICADIEEENFDGE